MYCPNCGKSSVERCSTCPECGSDVRNLDKETRSHCSICKRDVVENAKYCMWCGVKLDEARNVKNEEPQESAATETQQASHDDTKKKTANINARSIIGAFIGLIVYALFGMTIIIPLAAIVICYHIVRKIVKPQSRPMLVALSIQVGHLVWIIIGFVGIAVSTAPVAINTSTVIMIVHILAVGAGSIWLINRPGFGPVLFLTALQVLMFVSNLASLSSITSLPYDHGILFTSMIIHLILRVAAVISMFVGLYFIRRRGKIENMREA